MSKSSNEISCSVIVPAYKECGNLKPLTERLFAALKSATLDAKTELIIVDDNSQDGSEEIVDELRKVGKYNVRIIVRRKERGLSSAVMRGFDEARGNVLLCMDADLQHPPEIVPSLLKTMLPVTGGDNETIVADYVIGTRYGPGVAIDDSWPLHRRIISKGARLLALPLTSLSDPMSGLFGVQKALYDAARKEKKLSPLGFKIAMEVYVKCQMSQRQVAEVPFTFACRNEGESKLTGKVITHYLLHLKDLYLYKYKGVLLLLMVLLMWWLFAALT